MLDVMSMYVKNVTIAPGLPYIYPGPSTKSQLNKQAKHTTFYNVAERSCFAEHWKLVAEYSEFHLTLGRAHRTHFFPTRNTQKKREILSEKRGSGMALKSVSLRPKAIVLTPMHYVSGS